VDSRGSDQHAADLAATELAVQSNVSLVCWPRNTTAVMMTAAISATMRPYSTAVAPRSLRMFKRETTQAVLRRIVASTLDTTKHLLLS